MLILFVSKTNSSISSPLVFLASMNPQAYYRGVVRAPGLVVEVSRIARRAVIPRSNPHLIKPKDEFVPA